MVDVRGDVLWPPHCITPTAMKANKNPHIAKFSGYLEITSYLTEIFEQPRSGTPALNVMTIRGQRHANGRKQGTLLTDVDVSSAQSDQSLRCPHEESLGL